MVVSPINPLFSPSQRRGFTLIELLVVIAIMVVTLALVVPAFNTIKGTGDVTKGIYDLAGVLQTARSYATANNTYVWVGFYEENGGQSSTSPATSGTGRIVMSIVASNNGTSIYSQPLTISTNISTGLSQVTKLVKIDNMHLDISGTGTGTSTTFLGRPAVSGTAAQIANYLLTTGSSNAPFYYPLSATPATAQYTFKTAIQFSPRGEARLNEMTQPLQPVMEVGLRPTRGSAVAINSQEMAAVQITGIAGNVQIYRQ